MKAEVTFSPFSDKCLVLTCDITLEYESKKNAKFLKSIFLTKHLSLFKYCLK